MTGKKPRRGPGEGSIYQRKDGRFVASLPIDGPGRPRKYFYGKTRAEVREKLKQAQLEQRQGTLATGPRQTVQQFLEHWLENVHRYRVRLNTYRIYRQLLNGHVFPALGHIQLQKLSPQRVQELYAQKQKEGYAAETVRGIHRMLHRAFEDAVKWNLVASNVCDKVTQPRPVEFEQHPLTKEQAKQLLGVAKEGRLEALLTLAVATGMRRGELIGLRWVDIDFEQKILWVRHTVNRAGKSGIIENAPKTEKSKRKINLPAFVLDALERHRAKQEEMRREAGAAWKEQDIVFSNTLGGFTEASNFELRYKKMLQKAGLPNIRFHDLRHSAATILLEMNVNPKQVQELLGHSSIIITMDRYSHVLPSMQREMMDQLDDVFGALEPGGDTMDKSTVTMYGESRLSSLTGSGENEKPTREGQYTQMKIRPAFAGSVAKKIAALDQALNDCGGYVFKTLESGRYSYQPDEQGQYTVSMFETDALRIVRAQAIIIKSNFVVISQETKN